MPRSNSDPATEAVYNRCMSILHRNPSISIWVCVVLLMAACRIPSVSFAADGPELITINDSKLEAVLYRDFPSVQSYRFKDSGLEFDAASAGPGQLIINGEEVTPVVSLSIFEDLAQYELDLPELQVTILVRFQVQGKALHMSVQVLREKGEFQVHSVAFANSPLLSCSSADAAQFAGVRMYTKVEGTGDTFIALDGSELADEDRQGYMYAMLSNGQLCGSIWSNAVYDHPEGPTARENGRIWKQTAAEGKDQRTSIWSGDWLLRAEGSDVREPMGEARVIITADANADQIVDWQDGAIAYRTVMHVPTGAERICEQVVQRIPMNFASQATNPFLKTLDETKRIYLATGGLGQRVLLKGYQSEGHDSAHPDYAGNYNERAGGLDDLKLLVEQGKVYNADFGVHINAQEAYPEAHNFSDELVLDEHGWNWIDQAWVIDKRYDALSGNRTKRLMELYKDLPGLQFIYLDVWYQDGWESRRVAREINGLGWSLTTEFPTALEWDNVWTHWAVEREYGGSDLKGFHSDIARFIHNHQRDCWVARHPLLGGTELTAYEGWQGKRDFDAMLDTTFSVNLPTKWLQHFKILNWSEDEIRFTGNVVAKLVDGRRVITQDGRVVLDGDSYLLPWPPENPEKFYHWSSDSELTLWGAAPQLISAEQLFWTQCSDDGYEAELPMEIMNGQIALARRQPGVIMLSFDSSNKLEPVIFGKGSLIADPGFNAARENKNHTDSSRQKSEIVRNEFGDKELHVPAGNGMTFQTPLLITVPGTYAISLAVEVRGDTPRRVSLSTDEGIVPPGYPTEAWLDAPSSTNYIAADSKHDHAMQRMQLIVDIDPSGMIPMMDVTIAAGDSEVLIDDLQCVPAVRPPLPEGAYFFEDFENIVRGWYPFVKGDAGGVNDPRTHLSERHEPYTQQGWRDKLIDDVIDGNWSLKSHGDHPGLLYRTIPQNLRFEPGVRYLVSLDYECSGDNDHEIVISDSSDKELVIPLRQALTQTPILFRFRAAEDGSSWFGIRKPAESETDLVIDNILVKEDQE